MKALLRPSTTIGELQRVELDMPQPAAHQVVARVVYAGICGSDLDILNDRNNIYKPPVVQGHEFSAVVTAVGSEVTNIKVGDKVVSETVLKPCGQCLSCQAGDYHLCLDKAVLGWTTHGAFAEYVLLNSAYTHVLHPAADLMSAALVEPLAIAAETVFVKGRIQPGESVAVIGPGATGVLSALLAQALGANPVFLIGRSTSIAIRFPIASELGLKHCINSSEVDPIAYIHDHNNGKDLDLVIDGTGNINGFNLAFDLVKRNGRIVELGSITADAVFPWPSAAWKALELGFVFSSSRQAWEKAVEVFNRGDIDFKKMATDVFTLDDYEAAFAAADNSRQSFKVMFQPSTSEN
jgi:L-iditol 2-dehydrogenase